MNQTLYNPLSSEKMSLIASLETQKDRFGYMVKSIVQAIDPLYEDTIEIGQTHKVVKDRKGDFHVVIHYNENGNIFEIDYLSNTQRRGINIKAQDKIAYLSENKLTETRQLCGLKL